MYSDEFGDEKEETRQCPSCRMRVSVWATKCHHCGEELGRPRREEAKLTIKDLGGGEQTAYKPSGNVTGALESFRVEEVAFEASRNRPKPPGFFGRLLGRRAPEPPAPEPPRTELPELDAYSKNLAAAILDDQPRSQTPGRYPEATPPHVMVIKGVGVLVGIVVLYFVGSLGWDRLFAYLEARNRPPEIQYVNKAPEMLARGDRSIDVFEEAMKAVSIKDTPENRDMAAQVRELLLHDVDQLLGRNPWDSENYDTAYGYIQRAVNVDDHPSIKAKFAEVNAEVDAYKFVLKSISDDGATATFRTNHADFPPEVTVERADRLMDRFIVQRISKFNVDLIDDKHEGRKLTISPNEGVKSRYG